MPKTTDTNQLRRKTRIMLGGFFAEISADDANSSPVFHWAVQRSDKPGVIVLGEQSTYETARQEAMQHLMNFVNADSAAAKRLQHAAGA